MNFKINYFFNFHNTPEERRILLPLLHGWSSTKLVSMDVQQLKVNILAQFFTFFADKIRSIAI